MTAVVANATSTNRSAGTRPWAPAQAVAPQRRRNGFDDFEVGPRLPRRVSGYNLDELLPERGFHLARALTGSEGTCVTILEATVRLVPAWPKKLWFTVS